MFHEQISAAYDAAKSIKASAEAEGRVPTDEELNQIEAHLAKAEELEAKQARIDSAEKKMAAAVAPMPRKSVPSAASTKVEVGKDLIKDDPKKGFKKDYDFYMAVFNHGQKGITDDRLNYLAVQGSDEHQTQNDSLGGFLIPEGFRAELLKTDVENDPSMGRTRDFPMQSPTVKIPARVDKDHSTSVSGGLTVARKMETATGATSQMELEQIMYTANTLFGAAFATEELLNDSPISVAGLISDSFNEQFQDHLFNEKLNGTGVGEFEGVTKCPAFISVAKETGQTAATIVKENVLKMRSRCWGYQNAIWLANHDTYPQLAVIGGDGNGSGNLWQNSMVEGRPDMLNGRPIFFTEYTKTLGAANDLILINWREYLVGNYQSMQSAESIHVRFLANERCFKFFMRNDGRGWWRSALTPKNSTKTLSPFVGLAARA